MEAVVEHNYVAQEPDELTIRKGDVIKDIKVAAGGWWEGTLKDKRGIFPDNFVKVLDPAEGARTNERVAKHEEVTLRNGSGRKYCKVLFSYEPCNHDELKLVPDEVIEYMGEVEEGWWRGRIRGRTGVFPSNFVSSPAPEEMERIKEKKEFCRVLFPYEAANEDELTVAKGDIITLISRDAPDKGWWKGELKGQVGLFPDNFVEVITLKSDQHTDNQVLNNQASTTDSVSKVNQLGKRKETANVRKSLDIANVLTDTPSKKNNNASSSALSSVTTEKKPTNAIISSLKRFVTDNSSASTTNNGNGSAGAGLGEELDEVERGEGAPLSHLTASRAKAPRRRLPSTQHLRHHNATTTAPSGTNNTIMEDNMTNGGSDALLEAPAKDDESDGLIAKSRRKAPWVEELKLNQLERRKMGTERSEKVEKEVKKERPFSWLPPASNTAEHTPKLELDTEDLKTKEKEKEKPNRIEPSVPFEQPVSSPVSSTPAYVPYHLYSQLLDRVAVMEEKQTFLQIKVNQLLEQLGPFLSKAASDND